MVSIFSSIVNILLLNIIPIDGLFVEVGEYRDHLKYDVNHNYCGLSTPPHIHNFKYDKKCFLNTYSNKTVVIFRGIKWHKKNDSIESRIYRGTVAIYGEAPYSARLYFVNRNNKLVRLCSGSLVTFQWILTAAHCLETTPNVEFIPLRVSVGDIYRHSGLNEERVVYNQDHLPHPNFSSASPYDKYDIALVKVRTPFTRLRYMKSKRNDYYFSINTVCLPKRNQKNDNSEIGWLYGWGDYDLNEIYPDRLLKGEIELKPSRKCRYDELCAIFKRWDYKQKGCKGDSGGPLVQYIDKYRSRAIIAGIYSRSIGPSVCDEWKKGNSFVPISIHIDWILNTIKKES